MKNLFVSVIIPNYNHGKFLEQRIDSVLSQTYPFFEVIILDDCSTDNSRAIIEKYRGREKVTGIAFNEENAGSVFKQWDKGILSAKGELIWVAESDDFSSDNFLEILVAPFSDPDLVLSFSASNVINEKGDILFTTYYNNPTFAENGYFNASSVKDGREVFEKVSSSRNFILNASGAVFRKSAYMKVGGVSAEYKVVGDWKFWSSICLEGKVFYSKELLNYHRRHGSNTSSSKQRIKEENTKLLKENYKLLEKERLSDKQFWKNYFDHSFKKSLAEAWYEDFTLNNIISYMFFSGVKGFYYFFRLLPRAVKVNLSVLKNRVTKKTP